MLRAGQRLLTGGVIRVGGEPVAKRSPAGVSAWRASGTVAPANVGSNPGSLHHCRVLLKIPARRWRQPVFLTSVLNVCSLLAMYLSMPSGVRNQRPMNRDLKNNPG